MKSRTKSTDELLQEMHTLNIGLVQGRHNIPEAEDYVFKSIDNVMGFQEMKTFSTKYFGSILEANRKGYEPVKIYLFLTGLTSATLAAIDGWYSVARSGDSLVPMHYDKYVGQFVPQELEITAKKGG